MNITFTPQAEADLISIRDYIADYSEEIANSYVARLLQSIRILGSFPELGRPGRVAETREWSISGMPYIVIYRIRDAAILEILAVTHERREYP